MKFYTLCLLFFCNLLFSGEEIGLIVAVFGNAVVQRKGGGEETLGRNVPIYIDDLIKVEKKSIVQLKFTDGTLFNFAEETQFRVNKYVFNRRVDTDRFISELIKGGMRGISGLIAKRNPQAMEIKTPNAVMGLLGTIFEISIRENGTFFGCESGEIIVSNQTGEIILSPRVEQFGIVTSTSSVPQTLSIRPDELSLGQFALPRGCS